MSPEPRVIRVVQDGTADQVWLDRAEALHRDFRPAVPGDYTAYLTRMAAEGAMMAVVAEGDAVRAIAVYRRLTSTFGVRLYVDDLVTQDAARSRGHGKRLLDFCEAEGRRLGCDWLDLESGVQRARAHRFYFREGLHVHTFGFRKALDGADA